MNFEQLIGGGDFGSGSGYEELLKAMQAGQITGRDTANQSLTYEPLKVESLEATLKLLEFRTKDIVLFNNMPKLTAYNTVEEFLQLSSYGQDRGGFYNEGELSDVENSEYIRRAELVKYIQVTGEVTLQAQMVRSYVDAMRKEQENKVMWVMRRANQGLTKASSKIVPQEWNSLYTQHASVGVSADSEFLYPTLEDYYSSTVVIDLRGASLKQEDVEKGAVVVDDNFGGVSHLFAPTSVLSTLSQDFYQKQRLMMNAGQGNAYSGQGGTVIKSISTTIGDVGLMPDKFMKRDFSEGRTTADSATSQKAPNAPVAGVAPNVTADALSKFTSADVGTVYYAVSSINRFGESALTLLDASAVTLVAGQSVDLAFTAGVGGNPPATGFRIYRSEVTSAGNATGLKFFQLFDVSTSERTNGYDGGGAGLVRDRGRILPNCEDAFLTEMSLEVLSFKQLAPISRLDLAVISMSRRFITFLFGMPNLYAPKKMVKFINCGKKLTTT